MLDFDDREDPGLVQDPIPGKSRIKTGPGPVRQLGYRCDDRDPKIDAIVYFGPAFYADYITGGWRPLDNGKSYPCQGEWYAS